MNQSILKIYEKHKVSFNLYPYPVFIQWSKPIPHSGFKILDAEKALYMYMDKSQSRSIYIGKSEATCVRDRLEKHKGDGTLKKIINNGGVEWPIRIGEIVFCYDYTPEILGIIESLLIYKERNTRNDYYGCAANTVNTKSRKKKPGLIIFNDERNRKPLSKIYPDVRFVSRPLTQM